MSVDKRGSTVVDTLVHRRKFHAVPFQVLVLTSVRLRVAD